MSNVYDLIILGAGPAGLTAGLYAARGMVKTLILEKEQEGGQIVGTDVLENYPGVPEGTTGPSLIADMTRQAKKFGAEIKSDNIVEVQLEGEEKILRGEDGEYRAKAVIIATGASPRRIGCPGEKEFTGRGVSYCATCDGGFFTDLEVFVVGGGDSAIKEAIYMTKFAKKVTIVHRRQGFRAAKVLLDEAKNNPKIEWKLDTVVEEIRGDMLLESLVLKNTVTGELEEYFPDEEDGTMGVFVFAGSKAQTDLFDGILEMDDRNYLITDENMQTSIEGVYVAGDCRSKAVRQVVTAAADGAIAGVMAEEYIDKMNK